MKSIILDTDIGDDIDDALALTVALNASNIEIRGVVTVYAEVDVRARIAAKLLSSAGRGDILVAAGMAEPIKHRVQRRGWVDTQAVILNEGEQFEAIVDQGGVDFTKAVLDESETPITIVAIGPLTNIATLLTKHPECKPKIREIVIMGSLIGREAAEWNMKLDPEAAQAVFHADVPMRVIPLDTTEKCLMAPAVLEALGRDRRPLQQMVNTMTRGWLARFNRSVPTLHDPLAVGCVAAPELFEFTRMDIEVDLEPAHHYGVTRAQENPKSLVQVCTSVDYPGFAEFFAARFLGSDLVHPGHQHG